jgi:hypothetical protein
MKTRKITLTSLMRRIGLMVIFMLSMACKNHETSSFLIKDNAEVEEKKYKQVSCGSRRRGHDMFAFSDSI